MQEIRAQAGGGESGTDFGGVVAIVVNDGYAGGSAPRIWKRRSTPRKFWGVRCGSGSAISFQANAHRRWRCCSGVRDLVQAGHVQTELAEGLLFKSYVEEADRPVIAGVRHGLAGLNVKVRTTTRTIGDRAALNLREHAAQQGIVVTRTTTMPRTKGHDP